MVIAYDGDNKISFLLESALEMTFHLRHCKTGSLHYITLLTAITTRTIAAEQTRTMAVESRCSSHTGSAIEPVQTMKTKFGLVLDLWPFDLRVSARRDPAMVYKSTASFVGSASRFPFRERIDEQTDRQTNKQTQMELNALSSAGGYTAGVWDNCWS